MFQVESTKSQCAIEMQATGDLTVPTTSSITLNESCHFLTELQVIAHRPSPTHRTVSLVPVVRVRTSSVEEWVLSPAHVNMHTPRNLSIQHTLEQSPAGSTLQIPAGVYREDLIITKPVSLTRQAGPVRLFGSVMIASSNVTLDAIHIYPSDPSLPSLSILSSSDILIHNCKISQDKRSKFNTRTRNVSGIAVRDSLRVSVVNSVLSDCGVGLSLEGCGGCVVQTSTFRRCWNAVRVRGSGEEGLKVMGNFFKENTATLQRGFETGSKYVFSGNEFENNLDDMLGSESGSAVKSEKLKYVSGVTSSTFKRSCSNTSFNAPSEVIVTGSCSEVTGDDQDLLTGTVDDSPPSCLSVTGGWS